MKIKYQEKYRIKESVCQFDLAKLLDDSNISTDESFAVLTSMKDLQLLNNNIKKLLTESVVIKKDSIVVLEYCETNNQNENKFIDDENTSCTIIDDTKVDYIEFIKENGITVTFINFDIKKYLEELDEEN